MAIHDIEYREAKPLAPLAAFVESFWLLVNHGEVPRNMVLIPDGRIDVFFSQSATTPYQVTLRGLDTQPSAQIIPPHRTLFAISWKLLAAEYLLPTGLADLLESGCQLAFQGGATATADIIIGADGANSRMCKPPLRTTSSRCASALRS